MPLAQTVQQLAACEQGSPHVMYPQALPVDAVFHTVPLAQTVQQLAACEQGSPHVIYPQALPVDAVFYTVPLAHAVQQLAAQLDIETQRGRTLKLTC